MFRVKFLSKINLIDSLLLRCWKHNTKSRRICMKKGPHDILPVYSFRASCSTRARALYRALLIFFREAPRLGCSLRLREERKRKIFERRLGLASRATSGRLRASYLSTSSDDHRRLKSVLAYASTHSSKCSEKRPGRI